MKCARCGKEFLFEFHSVSHWLKASTLDDRQLSFILYNYGSPICEDCENDLRDSFYAYGVNPNHRQSTKRKG